MASHSSAPSASIVVPTRGRPDYLEVALASISPQAKLAGAELIVVDDAGPSASGHALAKRFGARYEPHPRPLGLNVARNTGVERSSGEVVVFVDDDVEVSEGWLAALLGAASAHPAVEVFTGPIRPRREGSPPLSCGREGPPITSLDLGPRDTPTRFAWGANMAIRRAALDRVGHFEVSLEYGGDEQEWQERLRAERPGNGDAHASTVLYVAGAALAHRRNAADARLRPLCRAAFARGKAARRFDAWRGEAPPRARAKHSRKLALRARVGQALLHTPTPPTPRTSSTAPTHQMTSSQAKAAPSVASTACAALRWTSPATRSRSSRAGAGASSARRSACPPHGGYSCSASSVPSTAGSHRASARSLLAHATTSRCTSLPRGSAASSRTSTCCSTATNGRTATGCSWWTMTSSCPAASSTAFCSLPSASAWTSPSPPTGSPRMPHGA